MENAGQDGSKGSEKTDSSTAQSGGDAVESSQMEAPKTPGISATAVLWTFGKCLSALLPVYLAGYYRISTSLVAFGLMVYSGWKHTREAKEARLKSAIQLLGNEQEYTSTKVFKSKRDLPAWVNFPDVEKVEWLNKVLHQAWPFIGQYLEKLLIETIAPAVRGSNNHLQTFNFTKIDMGDKPMKVVGVKAHTENDKGQVLLDVYISYVGNCEINVEVKRYFCKAGVKGVQLHGMMRVILEPLIGDVPIVGAVTMFFIRRPKLDINWTGLTNLLDIPGLNIMSDSMIMDIIASFLVLPNRLTVPLVPDLHVAQLRSPLPRGVVRIHLVEAADLASKDNYAGMIKGMSDPYTILRVGPQSFTSHHLDNTLNPKWGEMYEVIVHEVPGQELEVEVYDKDHDQDDFLGRTKVDLGIVKKSKVVDEWFPLKDTKTGRVHLRLEWLTLQDNTEKLDEVIQRNSAVTYKTADPPSAAILVVYLDKAEALPKKKGNKDPSPMVQLSVQDITRESRTAWETVNPDWQDAFTFFIQDPSKQDIDIQVKDNDRVQSLGSLTIPLSRLLARPQLSLDQWFQLENSGSASRIYINTVLRVLWIDAVHLEKPLSSSDSTGTHAVARPQHTTPNPNFATEGVLRIHLVAGQSLVAKDKVMGLMKGKSDPYVKVSIGGKTFKSHVIEKTLNPTWNEMYEVVLTDLRGQEVLLEVFDKDMDKDDFMGRLKIKLSDLITAQYMDEWFALSDVKSGRVHLILEWLAAGSESDVDQVLHYQAKQMFQNRAVPSAALLYVYLQQGHDLPHKKSGKEAKAAVELIVGGTSHKTKVCERSSSPHWDESFYFLVRDPNEEMLQVKLSSNWEQALGSLVFPVRELLCEQDLTVDQWLSLDNAPASQLLMRAQLKILCPKMAVSVGDKREPQKVSESTVPEKQPEEDKHQGSGDAKTAPISEPVSAPSAVTVPEDLSAINVPSERDLEVSQAVDLRPQQTTPSPGFGKEGVIRIHLREARDLVAKDKVMGLGKGNSDPYAKIQVGDTTFKSQVIKKNLNPTWNEMYELVLADDSCEELLCELYDKDMDKDDFLGRVKINMGDVVRAQYTDEWFTLSDVKSGRLHMTVEWMSAATQSEGLFKVLHLQSQLSYQNKAVPSAALLFVYLDRAHSLPLKKSGKEPKPAAELVMGGASRKSKVIFERSTAPQWEEGFHFLVRDPREEILIIKLSSNWEQAIGSLVLPVRELLSQPELVLDQWFKLDGALDDSQILLRAELKILESKQGGMAPAAAPEHVMGGAEEEDEEEEFTGGAAEPEVAVITAGDEEHYGLPVESEPEVASFQSEPEEEPASAYGVQEPEPVQAPPQPPQVPQQVEDFEVPDPSSMIGGYSEDSEPIAAPQLTDTANEELEQEEPEEPSYERPTPSAPPAPAPAPAAPAPAPEDVSGPPVLHPPHSSTPAAFASEGVLRIHLLEARELVAKDKVMGMGKGKSDPYVKIYIGDATFKSHVIEKTLNPTWNEMYELVLQGSSGLEVKMEVFDKDFDSDDFLGRLTLRLKDIVVSQFTDQWYTLKDIKSGQVHMVLEWLPLESSADHLDQVLHLQSQLSYQNKAVPSAALLFVYLDRAHSLPLKKSGKEPKPAAELVCGGTSYKSKVLDRSTSPEWKEDFHFLVHDPTQDMVIIKLSSNWEQAIGSLVLPVRELLSQPELVLDQWFKLDGAMDDSQILLRAELKVLESKLIDPAVSAGSLPRAAGRRSRPGAD